MSLTKQLWIALILVLMIAFGGTFAISTLRARDYLQQQLYLKNQDNVSSLALSISQLDKDLASLELLISAQFDSGHYSFIKIDDINGKSLIERSNPPLESEVPDWFQQWVPIEIEPGTAPIQDGWNLFGTLTLQSHSRFAYQALWQQTGNLLSWFVIGLLLCGTIGSLILKKITSPLHAVIDQAEAMGEQRFIRIIEPRTREFRAVVSAMNRLSGRIQKTLSEEAARLEHFRFEAHHDKTTGLLNREQYLLQLKEYLQRDDETSSGSFVLLRIEKLEELNKDLGRNNVDKLLQQLGRALLQQTHKHPGWSAARLNGTDLSLLAVGEQKVEPLASGLSTLLRKILTDSGCSFTIPLVTGATLFSQDDELGTVLARADNALAAAALQGEKGLQVTRPEHYRGAMHTQQQWKQALTKALKAREIQLGEFRVQDPLGNLLHYEAPARILINGTMLSAGIVVPAADQCGLLPRFDLRIIEQALAKIATYNNPLGVNISHQALADDNFVKNVKALLEEPLCKSDKLWLEIPEYGVFSNLERFKLFCRQVKKSGCKIGIEHAGNQLNRISELYDSGLDYIKIDSSLIRDIDSSPANQTIVRNFCTIAHTIGLIVIAEGVKTQEELSQLPDLGLDGMTGPAV